jgi:hypothetical protein
VNRRSEDLVVGIIWLAIVGTVVWVGFDAHSLGMKRGKAGGGPLDMGVVSWVICCLIVWVIAFPCYLVARSRYRSRRAQASTPVAGAMYQMPQVQQVQQHASTAPPQYSPDGQWWWNGYQWVPAPTTAPQSPAVAPIA